MHKLHHVHSETGLLAFVCLDSTFRAINRMERQRLAWHYKPESTALGNKTQQF